MMFENKKVIIDTDPGIDDAYALAFALSSDTFNVLGITTVAGNAPLETTTNNALRIVELLDKDIPVYKGEDKALKVEIDYSQGIECHGEDGLGEIDLPQPQKQPENLHAVDFIINTLLENQSNTITLVALGPLTNIALALNKNPDALQRVKDIYVMGGAYLHGNITPVAEFNFWADPDAAAIVFNSKIQIHMIGLNATEQVVITSEMLDKIKNKDTTLAQALYAMGKVQIKYSQKFENIIGFVPHDLVAMVACIAPHLIEWEHCNNEISVTGITRGECLIDRVDSWKKAKNCYNVATVKSIEILELFLASVLPDAE